MLHVTHPRPFSWKFRLLILLPLLVIASMPLFVYFQPEHDPILLMMWLTMIVVQLAVSIRTARLAVGMMLSVRKNDSLTLTPDEASAFPKVVLKAVLRATCVDHVILVLPRLGVAVAFAQYFSWMYGTYGLCNLDTFCYYVLSAFPRNPAITQILLTLVILLLLSLAENVLATVIGLGLGFIRNHNYDFLIFLSKILIMFGAVIVFVLGLNLVRDITHGTTSADIRLKIVFCTSPKL